MAPHRSKIAQSRMVVRAAPERPVVLALALLDRQVVDAGDAPPHQAVAIELPVLVAVGAEPLPAVVVPFIGKAHRDTISGKGPELLDQAIVQLPVPFARQESLDGCAALQKLGTIAPAAVGRIGQRDARRIAGVPGILRHAHLLGGGFGIERRKRRTARRAGHGLAPFGLWATAGQAAALRAATTGKSIAVWPTSLM